MANNSIVLADGTRLVLADGSRVAVTRQDNDLTKPDSVQSSYSTSFTLPDTAEVHRALEYAAEGTATTSAPYREVAAALEAEGVELLPRALLQLNGYEQGKGYDVAVLGGNRGFYAALGDKKLRELDLTRFGHNWTAANIFAGAARPAGAWNLGYCYELIDRGKGDPAPHNVTAGRYEIDPFVAECYPSTFARALFEQIFTEAGFAWRGAIPESFNRLTLPAPTSFGYSSETRAKYALSAGWLQAVGETRRYESDFTIVAPYNYVGGLYDFKKGLLAQFNPNSHDLTIVIPGFYNVTAVWHMSLECDTYLPGRVIGRLELWRRPFGGTAYKVGDDEVRTGSGDSVSLTVEFLNQQLNAGDVFWAYVIGEEESGAGPFDPAWYWGIRNVGQATLEGRDDARFELELLEQFPANGPIILNDWLPDLSCKDFIKSIVSIYSLQQRPDPYLNIIDFYPAATLLERLAAAPVWDGRRDARRPAQIKYQLPGSFGRQNWLRWKDDEANPEQYRAGNGAAAGLGDVALACPDVSLEANRDLLTLAFSASPGGANDCPLVPKWKAKADSSPVTYEAQTPAPRLLLRSLTRSRLIYGKGAAAGLSATVPLSYFTRTDEPADLSFARTLAPRYYPVLAAALAAPRVLRDNVRLEPGEIVNFDQLTPVFIEAEGHYFYVNKIDQYEIDSATTLVELLRLTF